MPLCMNERLRNTKEVIGFGRGGFDFIWPYSSAPKTSVVMAVDM